MHGEDVCVTGRRVGGWQVKKSKRQKRHSKSYAQSFLLLLSVSSKPIRMRCSEQSCIKESCTPTFLLPFIGPRFTPPPSEFGIFANREFCDGARVCSVCFDVL
jgi:hypothetical protein